MRLFWRRPLWAVCSAFTAGAALGFLLFSTRVLGSDIRTDLLLSGLLALLALCVIPAVLRLLFRRQKAAAVLCLSIALAAGLALGQSYLTFRSRSTRDLNRLAERRGEVTVCGIIAERRGDGGFSTLYTLDFYEINGIEIQGRAYLTCLYVSNLDIGDRVSMEVTAQPLEEAAGDRSRVASLIADGFDLGFVSEGSEEHPAPVTVEESGTGGPLVKITAWRHYLASRLNLLVGREAAGLPSALLLGERSLLTGSVRRDFARSGVSHLLAISGLHITLLFGLLEGILRLLRVPRRWRTVMLSLAAFSYLLLLGFPPSATRAVIMLGFVYLSVLCSVTADPLTSLGAAGVIILAVNPRTVADAGFWMSYMATFGLVSLSPLIVEWTEIKARSAPVRKLLQAICKVLVGLAVGIIAGSFTLFIVAAVIGEMGVLSPISTLILTPMCGGILILSLMALILCNTPAGYAFGSLAGKLSEIMIRLSAWMAEPEWSVISLRHPAVLAIAMAMLIVIIILLAVKLPKRARWSMALPLLVGWMAIAGILAAEQMATQDQLQITFLQPSSVADTLVMVEGRHALICDVANGSLTTLRAATTEAKEQGATEIAVLMLTHYHTGSAGSLMDILNTEMVRRLWLPEPVGDKDRDRMYACLEAAERCGVPVMFWTPEKPLRVFSDATLTADSTYIDRSVQPILMVTLDTNPAANGEGELVYLGSSVFESDFSEQARKAIAVSDAVIFGNHGPLIKQPFGRDLSYKNGVRLVVSAKGEIFSQYNRSTLPPGTTTWVGQHRLVLKIASVE